MWIIGLFVGHLCNCSWLTYWKITTRVTMGSVNKIVQNRTGRDLFLISFALTRWHWHLPVRHEKIITVECSLSTGNWSVRWNLNTGSRNQSFRTLKARLYSLESVDVMYFGSGFVCTSIPLQLWMVTVEYNCTCSRTGTDNYSYCRAYSAVP